MQKFPTQAQTLQIKGDPLQRKKNGLQVTIKNTPDCLMLAISIL